MWVTWVNSNLHQDMMVPVLNHIVKFHEHRMKNEGDRGTRLNIQNEAKFTKITEAEKICHIVELHTHSRYRGT